MGMLHGMRRSFLPGAVLGLVLAASLAATALADPPATNKNARFITLYCGGAGTFETVIGAATQFHLLDSTQTYVVTSMSEGGTLLFQVPGLASRSDQVSCTFTLGGDTLDATGFFTPNSG